MRPPAPERLRLALITSTVVATLLSVVFGVPRARAWLTPQVQRVWVVSAALGDTVASVVPKETASGMPVTLFAILEATPRFGGVEPVLFGHTPSVRLAADAEPRPVEEWSTWWYAPEFLWFKVEPTFPFTNETFDPGFVASQIAFTDNYQVSWGFGWSHAADIDASGDAYPELGAGTMRFMARAVIRDRRDRILQRSTSPGGAAVHATLQAGRPHRVTVRAGDDAFGFLHGFAGLPYVPVIGTPREHPAELFLGGTILAFWQAAQRAAGAYHGPILPWDRLDEIADRVVDDMFLATDGTYYWTRDPLRAVDFDVVRPGDILTIDDHAGVLYEDRGPGGGGDGLLNRWDRAFEAYFEPLRTTQLGEAFVADIAVWRLREPSSGAQP